MNGLNWHFSPISVAYCIAAAGLLALAAWSGSSYRRTKSLLTKYLALSGLLAGLYFLASSLPFLLTTNIQLLKLADITSSFLYFLTILVQTRLFWYLAFKNQRGYASFAIPVGVLAAIGFISATVNTGRAEATLSHGVLVYTSPPALLHLYAILNSLFIIIGIYILKIGRSAQNGRGKLRIFSLSLAYLVGGLIGVYNALFVGGANNSPSVLVVYTLVFGLLLVVSLIGRIQNIN